MKKKFFKNKINPSFKHSSITTQTEKKKKKEEREI